MQASNILVWSFYTDKYKEHADKLIKSLEIYHPDYMVMPVECTGDWQLNVKQRTKLIRVALEAHQRPVLAVDCDCTFHAELPDLEDVDFSAHIMDKGHWGQDTSKRSFSLMGGTLLFNHNDRVIDLLRKWEDASFKTKQWEQRVLESITGFNKWDGTVKGPWSFSPLPCQLCAIDRTMKVKDAVIRHHQASRKLKGAVNA